MGLQDIWGPLVAWDLFLAGAGAGAYLIGVLAGFLGSSYKALSKMGVYLGAPLVALGAVILMIDLGHPLRFMLGFLQPGSSMMSVGIIIISVFLVVGGLHFIVQVFFKKLESKFKWLGVVGAIFALGVMSYTGLLLGMVVAIPFWNTPMLPVLFVTSALATGTGAIFLALAIWRWVRPASAKQNEEDISASVAFLGKLALALIIVELIVLAFFLLVGSRASDALQMSVAYLTTGDYAIAFWLGIICVGLILPLIIAIWSLVKAKTMNMSRLSDLGAVAGLCLLIGGVVLRYAVLAAGAPVSLGVF